MWRRRSARGGRRCRDGEDKMGCPWMGSFLNEKELDVCVCVCVKVGGDEGSASSRGQSSGSSAGGGGGEADAGGGGGGPRGDAGGLHPEGESQDPGSEAQAAALCEERVSLQTPDPFPSNVSFSLSINVSAAGAEGKTGEFPTHVSTFTLH